MTLDPPPRIPDTSPPAPRRASSSQVAVVVIVVAALVALIGAVILTRPGAQGSDASATPAVTASPSVLPSGSPSVPASPPSPSADATAIPSAGMEAVLAGAGDIGDCSTDEDTLTGVLLESIEGTIFTAGDNAYENGLPSEFRTCYDTVWGSFKYRTRPAPGNHEWQGGGLDGYFGYFGAAAKGPRGSSWYSYDLGAWHVIVLDSECGKVGGCRADSKQGRWLAADLAASDTGCTIAIWHRPRFSSGEHGNDKAVAPFWTKLYDAGVDVVVNGHDHDFERFAPQDPSGSEDQERGIRQFVIGTGGTALRAFKEPVPNSEVRLLDHGVFKLTLRDGSYDWEFIPVVGDASDTGTGSCH
jgi:calcineurin-like phosphoesterase family protein